MHSRLFADSFYAILNRAKQYPLRFLCTYLVSMKKRNKETKHIQQTEMKTKKKKNRNRNWANKLCKETDRQESESNKIHIKMLLCNGAAEPKPIKPCQKLFPFHFGPHSFHFFAFFLIRTHVEIPRIFCGMLIFTTDKLKLVWRSNFDQLFMLRMISEEKPEKKISSKFLIVCRTKMTSLFSYVNDRKIPKTEIKSDITEGEKCFSLFRCNRQNRMSQIDVALLIYPERKISIGISGFWCRVSVPLDS